MPLNARGAVVVGVPVDGSADGALDWAVDDAARRHRPLLLVAAAERSRQRILVALGPPEREATSDPVGVRLRAALDRARARAENREPAVDVTVASVRAHPVTTLVDAARSADCLVVGSHGRTRLGTLLLRSLSQTVASQSSCPVVVVREPGPHPLGPERTLARRRHGRVVVGVDGSRASSAATELAIEQADLRGSVLVVVHAWRPPGGRTRALPTQELWQRAHTAEVTLASDGLADRRVSHPDVEVRTLVLAASPVDALVFTSETADLLVVGSHGWGDPSGLLLGSVSQAVLRRAGCPVAVVPTPRSGGAT